MTLNDVKNDVAALGFDSEIELDNAFIGAVNRALFQIYTERRFEKVMRIFPSSQKSSFYKKELRRGAYDKVEFSCEGLSFAFRSFGKGTVEISDELGIRRYSFEGENSLTRGFIRGKAKFSFIGDFCYTVSDFTVYSELGSENADDIFPLGETVFFDPKKYDARFIGFSSYPYDDRGNVIKGSVIDARGLGIRLPCECAVNINYRCEPRVLTRDMIDTEIDMPPGCEHLLGLLVAHYVWLDDDIDKANHYLTLYREAMSAIRYYSRELSNIKYTTNGWA